ncbi:MAG: flagellin [Lachnospiraceae bacterium]|nr:flagellin [Lachnospiraceae bacterium]
MIVKHNITAMNSNRMLGLTTSSQAKSTEKLSSGYKINRAADDAAGLSISEKMRRQVRGLTQASSNAQDGISVVQTAEGALNEVEDMLQRMNELAVKGENGTLTTSDRASIQAEIGQLMSEIDRVQSTTTFNEMNLLDGKFIKGLQVGAEAGQHIDISIKNMSISALASYIGSWSLKDGKMVSSNSKLYGAITYNALQQGTSNVMVTSYSSYKYTVAEKNGILTGTKGDKTTAGTVQGYTTTVGVSSYSTVGANGEYKMTAMQSGVARKLVSTFQNLVGGKPKTVATTQDFNSLNAFIKGALQIVSSQRSDLGAIQNRLEHTINNLNNIVENTQSAEAAIRDTDIATEMVQYSNNNILQQAGTSMLSQANQGNQLALSLLG